MAENRKSIIENFDSVIFRFSIFFDKYNAGTGIGLILIHNAGKNSPFKAGLG